MFLQHASPSEEALTVDQLCGDLLYGRDTSCVGQSNEWGAAAGGGAWSSDRGFAKQNQAKLERSTGCKMGSSMDGFMPYSNSSLVVQQTPWSYMPELSGSGPTAAEAEVTEAMPGAYTETETRSVIHDAAVQEAAGVAQVLAITQGTAKVTAKLLFPNGWEERTAPDGRQYYLNHQSRTTTWDDPRKQAPPKESISTQDAHYAAPAPVAMATLSVMNHGLDLAGIAVGGDRSFAGDLPQPEPYRAPMVKIEKPMPRDGLAGSRRSGGLKRSSSGSGATVSTGRWPWPPLDDPAREAKSAARHAALNRFRQKKVDRANRPKNVRYKSRKKIADNRPRVSGRFVKTSEIMRAASGGQVEPAVAAAIAAAQAQGWQGEQLQQ